MSLITFLLSHSLSLRLFNASLQVCGRYFCDFLTGIDNIHLQMRYMYPKMVSPSMYISHEDAQGVVLNYRTTRNGFCPYLLGTVRQLPFEHGSPHRATFCVNPMIEIDSKSVGLRYA